MNTALKLQHIPPENRDNHRDIIRQTVLNNYPEWGSPALSEEQYLERERVLESTAFSRKSLHLWVLLDGDGSILAQCETYHRECWIKARNSAEIHRCLAASVASVFVLPKWRGKGIGTRLMEMLRQSLVEMDIQASNLYSDVGRLFYSRPELGWRPYSTAQLVVDTRSWVPAIQRNKQSAQTIPDLDALARIVNHENASLEAEMLAVGAERSIVTIPLSVHCVVWFQERAKIYQQFTLADQTHLPIGCWIDDDNWMIYFFDFKANTLVALYHRISVEGTLEQLLSKATEDAKHFGLLYVHIWQPCKHMMDELLKNYNITGLKGRADEMLISMTTSETPLLESITIAAGLQLTCRSDDEGSISSLAVYPPFDSEPIEWLRNYKHAWV